MARTYERDYNTKLQRQRRRRNAERAHGRTFDEDLIPAGKLRKRVRDWRRYRPEITDGELARMCQVEKGTIQQFMTNRKYVTRYLRDTLLEVMATDGRAPAQNQKVSNELSRQLLGSMQAQGWTLAQLASMHPELKAQGLNKILYDEHTTIFKYNEDRIKELAETVGDKHGPSNIAKARARKRGLYPLIHYTPQGKLIENSIPSEQR